MLCSKDQLARGFRGEPVGRFVQVDPRRSVSLGSDEGFFINVVVERYPLPARTLEDGAPGAPVVFGTEEYYLLPTAALEDHLLRTLAHVDLLPPLSGSSFMALASHLATQKQVRTFERRAQRLSRST